MEMLMMKIQKSKFLKIFVSLCLCLIIMLSSIAPALRPKAIIEDLILLTEEILRGIGTVAAHMGIQILLTDEGRQSVADFWGQLSDHTKENFQNFALRASVYTNSYYVFYEWQRDQWIECAQAVADWFTPERYEVDPSITFGKVQVSNGLVNLNSDNSLYFTIPVIGEGYNKVEYNVNDCNICIYFNTPRYVYDEFVDGYHGSTSDLNMGTFLSIEPFDNSFDLRFICSMDGLTGGRIGFQSGGVYSNSAFLYSGDYDSSLVLTNIYTDHAVDMVHNFQFTHKSLDGKWGIFKNSSNRWGFSNNYGSTLYNDLSFDSYFDCLNYFFTLCGMPLDRSALFNPSGDVPDVQIDSDLVSQRLQEAEDMPVDSTLSMVVPSTDEQYVELLQNPDRIVDVSATGVYNGDIDMPTVNGNLWSTKFPFCLPFDIIRLFSGFVTEPEAPSFHLLVMPANSFGLSNEDIYWDIDFSDYNYLVQILRFFIAVSFVVWLIVLTRKIIGS